MYVVPTTGTTTTGRPTPATGHHTGLGSPITGPPITGLGPTTGHITGLYPATGPITGLCPVTGPITGLGPTPGLTAISGRISITRQFTGHLDTTLGISLTTFLRLVICSLTIITVT